MPIEKLLEDCFEGIKSGLIDNDRKKMWRGFYRLKNLLLGIIGDSPLNVEDDTIS